MIALPPELIEQIKFYCDNNNLGMSAIAADHLYIITIGNNEISANTIHLAAAHMMIAGVLRGAWEDANAEAEQKHEEEKERKPF